MKDFKGRQKLRSLLYSPVALVVLLIIFLLLSRGVFRLMSKERESARVLTELRESSEELYDRQVELKGRIESLQTEEGVAREIRSKFNATRDGEYLAVIVDNSRPKKASTSTLERIKEGWYKFLKFWHF